MRRIYLLWLLGIIILMPISLTSCSDDNIGSSNDLIGTWESVSLSGWYKENKEIVEKWEDEPDDDFKISSTKTELLNRMKGIMASGTEDWKEHGRTKEVRSIRVTTSTMKKRS